MADFPETRWTLLERARSGKADVAQQALAELFSAYWLPMCQFIRWQFSLSPDQAEEIVQGFVVEKLLDGELLEAANQNQGRLRNLLCTSLKNYAISQFRGAAVRRHALERMGEVLVPASADSGGEMPPAPLDVGWAVRLFSETLGRMEGECQASGHADRWYLFEQRLLRPLFIGCEPTSYDRLVGSLHLAGHGAAMNMLVSAKRQFARSLRAACAGHKSGGQVDDEDSAEWLCGILKELLLRHRTAFDQVVWQMSELCQAASNDSKKDVPRHRSQFVNHEAVQRGLALIGEFSSLPSAEDGSPGYEDLEETPSVSQSDVGVDGARVMILLDLFEEPSAGETMDQRELEALAASFTRQLEGPLPYSVAGFDEQTAAGFRVAFDGQDLAIGNLEELLLHPHPPLEMLRLTKDYAKIRRGAQDETLPVPAATAIYFLAIALALVRCDSRISALSEAELAEGWRWGRDAQWLDEKFRRLFQEALDRLAASSCG